MSDDQGTSPYTGREIVDTIESFDLYTQDDERVGRVVEVNPDYLVVEGGAFFQDATMIPRQYVARQDEDRWYLSVGQDQLSGIAQAGSSGYQTGYTETSNDQAGAYQESGYEQQTGYAQPTTQSTSGDTIQLHEEELQATKVAQQAGEVTISKDVVEETRTIEVPVTREEVRVERRPVSGEFQSGQVSDTAFTGDSITVPVMEEQVQVQKVSRPVEEIEIQKVATQQTQQVQDTVRRETVDIEEPGTTGTTGTTGSSTSGQTGGF